MRLQLSISGYIELLDEDLGMVDDVVHGPYGFNKTTDAIPSLIS